LNAELVEILACPICKASPLRYEQSSQAESLICPACNRVYQVVNGIADMLPVEIDSALSLKDAEWNVWNAKLENFILWRKRTWDGSHAADKAQSYAIDLKEKFVGFAGLRDSSEKIIDIGCGDGGIRKMLGRCSYNGIDPLLIENHVYDFPMVRGVGEYLPFVDEAFDEAILTQILDHCNSIDGLIAEVIRVTGKNGSVNVMQYISKPEGIFVNIYHAILRFYLSVKGIKNLDTKMRHFDMEGLLNFFRDRFEEVRFLKYSDSQLFVRASIWKKGRR
jgi:uncharacterized protein YbaR (Trm112 family)